MTTNVLTIKKGTLSIYEAFNGYYLYGRNKHGETICLGCMGDGVDDVVGEKNYNPNQSEEAMELEAAYNFLLI